MIPPGFELFTLDAKFATLLLFEQIECNVPQDGDILRGMIRLENINVPEAFAPASSVLAAGWQADHFDAQLPEGANAEQLARWTREQSRQSR